MELFADIGNPEADPGEWFTFKGDAQVLVRRIPPAVARSIEFRHSGRKRHVTWTRKGAITEVNAEKSVAETADGAAYALLDSKNFEVRAKDDGAAAFYSKAIGAEVNAGDLVRLDGHWTPAVKERLIDSNPAFARFIVAKAASLQLLAQEEEEGKDES